MSELYSSVCFEDIPAQPDHEEQRLSNAIRIRVAGLALSTLAVMGVTSCDDGGDRFKHNAGLTAGYVAEKDYDKAKMGTKTIDTPVGCVKKDGNISTNTVRPNAPAKSTPRGGKAGKSVSYPMATGIPCTTTKVSYVKKPEKYELTLKACFGAPDTQDCRENEIEVSQTVYDSAIVGTYFDPSKLPPYNAPPNVFMPE